MNWDRIAGRWNEFKGQVREQWGKLTDDDLDVIGGRRDQLIGLIQRRYGTARDEAERQVEAFESQASAWMDEAPAEERESWTRQQAAARQQGGQGRSPSGGRQEPGDQGRHSKL